MLIRIPFDYEETVTPKGARNPRTQRFGEWTTIDIMEVSSSETPLVAEWENNMSKYSNVNGKVQIRYFDDSFYEALTHTISLQPSTHIDVKHLIETTNKGNNYCNPLIEGVRTEHFAKNEEEYTKIEHSNFREVLTDNRTEELNDLQERANNILIIDDMIWVKTSEPVLSISRNYNGFNISINKIDIVKDQDVFCSFFKLDKMDEAIENGKEITGYETFTIFENPAIYMSEVLNFKDDAHAILKSLNFYFSNTKDNILDRDRHIIDMWLDARDNHTKTQDINDEENIETTIQFLKQFILEEDIEFYEKELLNTINRWERRPIEFDDINFKM